jgi:hypothetical protein
MFPQIKLHSDYSSKRLTFLTFSIFIFIHFKNLKSGRYVILGTTFQFCCNSHDSVCIIFNCILMWLCNYNKLWLYVVCANVAIQSSRKVHIPHLIWSSLEQRILFTNGVIFRLQSSVHRGTNHELSWTKPSPNTEI